MPCLMCMENKSLSTEQGARIWITGARVIKIRADIVQRERGIISEMMPWRNKSVCLLFYSLHLVLSLNIFFWGTETDHSALSLFLQTWMTCSCDFNFTEVGQRHGNVIQLLAKTSSSMCILWTFQNFSGDLCQDVPRAKWRQEHIPNKWHLSGWGSDASYE